jgi:O-antigen/teichoic acid export membrane protein
VKHTDEPSRRGPTAAPAVGVRRNAQWLLMGNAIYAAGYWMQFIILARAGGPSAVGSYAYAQALAAPAVGIASLQLRGLLASDVAGAFAVREYLALRAAAVTAAMFAAILIGWGTNGARILAVLIPVCVMRALESLSDIYYGAWQLRQRMGVIGWSLAVNGMGSAALMALALELRAGVPGAAAGAALGSGIAFAFVYRRTFADSSEPRSASPAPLAPRRLLLLARQAAPLGIISFLNAIQSNVPRYFIRAAAGEAALGLFAAAYQLPASGGIVVAALGSAAVPRLASLHAAGNAGAFGALVRKLLGAGALLGGAGVALSALAGGELLSVLYNPSFSAAHMLLVILSAAASLTFLASLQGYALTSARVIAIQPAILSTGIAILAVGCAVLVPRLGAIGAAWAMVAASGIHALASALVLRLSGNFRGHGAAGGSPAPLRSAEQTPGTEDPPERGIRSL